MSLPAVLLQRVDWGDVVCGDPSHGPVAVVGLAPLAGLVEAQDSDLLGLLQTELVLTAGLEVVEGDKEVRVFVRGGRQEVLPRRPPVHPAGVATGRGAVEGPAGG